MAGEVIKKAKKNLKKSESDDIELEKEFIEHLGDRLLSAEFKEISHKAYMSSSLKRALVEQLEFFLEKNDYRKSKITYTKRSRYNIE